MNNPQPTPLEKLISDRRRIQQECTIQEQKLNADFSYIQENAGTLLLSGGTRLITCCMGCCTPIIDSLGHPESPGVDNKETFQEKEISCNN